MGTKSELDRVYSDQSEEREEGCNVKPSRSKQLIRIETEMQPCFEDVIHPSALISIARKRARLSIAVGLSFLHEGLHCIQDTMLA